MIWIGLLAVWRVVKSAKYRYVMRNRDRDRPMRYVSARFGEISDANDDAIYVTAVNGRRLVHKELDQLVEDTATVIDGLITSGEYVPTESAGYYEAMTEAGQVDVDTVRGRVEQTRGRFETAFRLARNPELSNLDDPKTGYGKNVGVLPADREAVMRYVRQECPDEYVDRVVAELEAASVLEKTSDVLYLQEIPDEF